MSSRLLVLAAAFLFSTGGAAIKATTLAAWPVASLRSLIAALALLALLPAARRGWTPTAALAAVAYALTLVLFAVATKLTTSASAIFLQSTAPVYLLALSPLLLGERLGRADWIQGALVAAGMLLCLADSAGASATAPDPLTGNLLGAASGLAWAFSVAGLRASARAGTGSLAVATLGNLFAFLFALPFAWPLPVPAPADWAALLYLGVIQIGLAYVCLTRGLAQVPAFTAAALLLVEPALNPFWTWLLHGERPGVLSLAGGAVILAATLGYALLARPAQASAETSAAVSAGEI